VGDLSPRKNVAMLLDAWARVHTATGLTLAVAGAGGPHSAALRDRLAAQVDGSVRWLHEIDDRQLRWAYEHARVVLVPSLEEGFGLPIVEARAFGAAVVASQDPALVEVGASVGGVVHVPASDPDAWCAAIAGAALTHRDGGPPRIPSGATTWDEHAARVVELARDLVAGRDV
jgi:glycosyltransferase involved in cell wall biosynthesis